MNRRLEEALQGLYGQPGVSLVALLQLIQQEYGYLPEAVLREVARAVKRPLVELYRVATFYHSFSLKPRGRHKITICCGTACHVRGSEKVTREIAAELGVEPGETTADGQYSLETVNCLGACAMAPLVTVDGEYYGNLSPAGARLLIREHKQKAVCKCREERVYLPFQQNPFRPDAAEAPL